MLYLSVTQCEISELSDWVYECFNCDCLIINGVYELEHSFNSLPVIANISNIDNIAILPETFIDFINSLGKQTKKHSKYYLGRIERNFNDVSYNFSEESKIELIEYRCICAMSRKRMVSKAIRYEGGDSEHALFKI